MSIRVKSKWSVATEQQSTQELVELYDWWKKPVHWFICQLQANELPLRHLFAHLDGPTTGPCGFPGPIGKLLSNCDKLLIREFAKIEGYLPPIDSSNFSTDKQYMHDISSAAISGVCPLGLALRNPGLISHSRWLSTGNRIMRLYVVSENSSDELYILARFVLQVYVTMWLTIQCKPSCKDGANHLFLTIAREVTLSDRRAAGKYRSSRPVQWVRWSPWEHAIKHDSR